jgi:hypothetical protein
MQRSPTFPLLQAPSSRLREELGDAEYRVISFRQTGPLMPRFLAFPVNGRKGPDSGKVGHEQDKVERLR